MRAFRLGSALSVLACTAVLAACSGTSVTPPPAPAASATPPASAPAPSNTTLAAPPLMLAVTTAGALVVLDPVTGAVSRTLVPSGVLGDEISVSASGTVYFAAKNGCGSTVKAVPALGGTVIAIAPGSTPAISPDGTKLAYASQPSLAQGCVPSNPDLVPLYHLQVRTLSSGAVQSLPMLPASQDTGLPAPISHLSWAADGSHLAVSIASVQDNEGWAVNLLDTAQAQDYLSGAGVTTVPVTGSPTPQQSYLREGIYLPDGNLFVSRACCGGFPVRNTSRLMWEVSAGGALVHQVAIGYVSLEHTSLAASADGRWLLYLAGSDLYVSQGGATPRKLASGFIAATFA